MNIRERIQAMINTTPSDIGILITDGKNSILSHNEQKPFRSASVIKLFVLSYYLDKNAPLDKIIKIDKSQFVDYSIVKELAITEATIYDLLLFMIASSDNTATNVLASLAGFANINDYIGTSLGLSCTSMNRLMLDFNAKIKGFDNYTSAADVVFILNHLSRNPVALEILREQKDSSGLMRYIYSGVEFFGKSGELDDVRNDSGILKTKNKFTFAAVLTNNINKLTAESLCGLCGLLAVGSENMITGNKKN